jgi:hypothetical protein
MRPAPLLLVLSAAAALPARADLVVLVDGGVMKVAAYEVGEEAVRLTFPTGGAVTMPLLRVERIVDDEVIPEPPRLDVADLPALPDSLPAPPIPLRFEESQAVPAGPFGKLIYETAKKHSVNPSVVAALIRAESAGNPRAVSPKGARGLMQLMPATANRFGVRKDRLFDPRHNLEAGIQYLSWLVDQFPGDLGKILAAYNAGEQAVWRYAGIPPYRETKTYVRRIYSFLGLTLSGV